MKSQCGPNILDPYSSNNLMVSKKISYQSKNGQLKQPSIHTKNIKGSSQDLSQFVQSFQQPIVALSPNSPRNAQRYCIPNITITVFQQISPSNMLANQTQHWRPYMACISQCSSKLSTVSPAFFHIQHHSTTIYFLLLCKLSNLRIFPKAVSIKTIPLPIPLYVSMNSLPLILKHFPLFHR